MSTSNWFGTSSTPSASSRDTKRESIEDNAEDKKQEIEENMDSDFSSGFRHRADEGAVFTASKCPHGSGLEYSCELPFGLVWTPMAVYKNKEDEDDGENENEDGEKNKGGKIMSIIECDGDVLPPVLCLACTAYINPFAEVDFKTGIWSCPLCGHENVVPKKLLRDGSKITTALNSSCVEYRQALDSSDDSSSSSSSKKMKKKKKKKDKHNEKTPARQEVPDYCTYLLVVDENMSPEDGQAIGPALEAILEEEQNSSSINSVFPKTRIGLVVFGKSVSMYQLGLSSLASADVYVPTDPASEDDDADVNIETENRAYLMEVKPGDALTSLKNSLSSIFGVSVEETDKLKSQTSTFSSRLAMLAQKKEARIGEENEEDSEPDIEAKSPWTKRQEKNLSGYPKRCTGEALQCAIDLVGGTMSTPSRTSRILLFTNGCPNIGDGNVLAPNEFSQTKKKTGDGQTHDVVDTDLLQQAVEYFDTTASFAGSAGIGIDVFCSGVTELALPVYQAMVAPTGGYVIPLVSLDTPQFERNLEFILHSTYISRSMNHPEELPEDVACAVECVVDIRSDSFVTPSQLIVSGAVIPDVGTEIIENEMSAYKEGSKLAEGKGIKTKNLPSRKAMELSLTRVQLGRVDPLSTITVMMEIEDSISEDDDHAFFQLVTRYVSRKGDEEITRVCSFQIPVAKDVNDFVSSIDDEAMSVVLAKAAVYRSLHGRDESSETRDLTAAEDAEAQETAQETQEDIDVTVQRISGAFRRLGPEEKTRSSKNRKSKKSGSRKKATESSLNFAFPPSMKETLNRLYHLRRSPLINPGPMLSVDYRAESRGLFLRFPLEDCLQMIRPTILSTGSVDGVSSPWDKMLPFPAETLILWDDSIIAADLHHTLFIWSGTNCKTKKFGGIREKFEFILLESTKDRFPQPELCMIEDGDSTIRKFTARLAPSHADPIENQIIHFPELSELKPEALKALRSKFKSYDSKSDESFRTWFGRVASASNTTELEGMSLCE